MQSLCVYFSADKEARVLVDGKDAGQVNHNLTVMPGEHKISLKSKAPFAPQEKLVTVEHSNAAMPVEVVFFSPNPD